MTYPQQSGTVHAETLNDELCLYDWQRKEVHALNPTAAKVWQMCDGRTSPAQMATQLQAQLGNGLDATQAEALMWSSLNELSKANLLQGELNMPASGALFTRRQLIKVGIALALVPVITSILAPSPVAAQSGPPHGTQTFSTPTATGVAFTVPAGVTSLQVDAYGAAGGQVGGGSSFAGGGRATLTIAVTPGETLTIFVGGRGGDGAAIGNAGGVWGVNGGGHGGDGNIGADGRGGGGGGGWSGVRRGATLLVLAGGGGGRGGHNVSGGGTGGGTTGDAGASGSGGGGTGGTQAAGGTGGVAGGGTANSGASGASLTGGPGGYSDSGFNNGGGGGGGGGYFGGGGGGGGNGGGPGAGGNGGGGSSYPVGATHQQGVRAGDGQVILTW